MKAFIFTAGYGERLKPVTDTVPKPLVPVLNCPAIEWPLALLKRAGIRDVVCNLHHLGNAIEQYFEDRAAYDFNVAFSFEKEILGTGGGLKKCETLLGDDEFLVLNGDVVMDLNINALLAFHKERKSRATVVLYPHPSSTSVASVGVKNGLVADFKNFLGSGLDSGFVYTGAAVLSPEIFEYLKPEFSSIVYTAYIEFIKRNALHYFVHRGYWHDIGTAEALYRANMAMLDCKAEVARLFAPLGIQVRSISPLAAVDQDAIIEKSIIGAHTTIAKGARVVKSVVLPKARVAEDAIVHDALLWGEMNLLG